MDCQQSNVERFLKLGYSHRDIVRVLESLRHDAQTNDILEELIKTCHSSSRSSGRPSPPGTQLVSRGCSPTQASQPARQADGDAGGFRHVVIDGSNVAMSHGNKQVFSCRGLQLAVQWFSERGFSDRDITIFVPLWRKEQPRPEAPLTDQHILHKLEKRNILVYTPSRCVNGKRVVCYDDRYIVKLAFDADGIIVSNDNYRDLQIETPQWKKFIEERLLMYSFANDKFMPPDDPLGRYGPTIDNFLRKKPKMLDNKQQHCPYGKKCTYGVKCKFYHPERANQSQLSVADELRALNKSPADRELPFPSTTRPLGPEVLSHLLAFSEPGLLENPYGNGPATAPTHRSLPTEQFQGSSKEGQCPLPPCPSLDLDEAFGSGPRSWSELSVARLCIQEPVMSQGSGSYSSGVGGSSHCSSDFFISGSRCSVGAPASGDSVLQGDRQAQPRGSYGQPVPTDDTTLFVDRQYPPPRQPFAPRQPREVDPVWGWGEADVGLSGGKDLACERRRCLRTQLSTIFPKRTVEHVMTLYPDVLDVFQLIPLIQRFRHS